MHALQTWLHCDFRTALLDEDILRDVAAVLVVGGRKGDPAKEVLRRAVALLPVRLIDRCVLDGGSAEIFPHWQE